MTSLFGGGSGVLSASGTLVPQSFVPSFDGQTVFTITSFSYVPDTTSILVFVNGQKQRYNVDYTETSSTSFTLTSGVTVNDVVEVLGFPKVNISVNTILDNSVTSSKILDSAVTNPKLAPNSVTSDKIADGAVGSTKLAGSSVTTGKIADGAVTVSKLNTTGTPTGQTSLRGDGSWQVAAAGSGGGTDSIFILNGQTVTTDYSIPSGQNAGSFGPITVNTGITVTIPTGSVWTIV